MLGLSSGLIKGTSVLRSIVKKGLQAWYKADHTQAPLGEEEIIDGDFSPTSPNAPSFNKWTKGSNWSISGGYATSDGSAAGNLDQTALIDGRRYKVTLDVSNMTTGALSVRLGGTNQIANINANGTYTFYGTANATVFRLRAQDVGGVFDGSVTNISVKEVVNSVKDFSSNTNNGVLYSGKCLHFDNSNYIDIDYWASKTIDANTKATFATWVNPDDIDEPGDYIFGAWTVDNTALFYLGIKQNKLDLGWGNSGWTGSVTSGALPTLVNHTWYRVVAVVDGLTCKVYLNGEFVFSKTNSSSFTIHSTGISIGAQGDDVGDHLYGELADFQIYDKAWTVSDVTYDYNNPDKDVFDNSNSNIVTTDCTALYRLNEGAEKRLYNAAPVLGEELVNDGGFATDLSNWGSPSNWVYANGGAKKTAAAGSGEKLEQTISSLVNGNLYSISFDLNIEDTAGETSIGISNTGAFGHVTSSQRFYQTSGTKKIIAKYVSSGYNNTLKFVGAGSSVFTIDNVSVKEISLSESYIQEDWVANRWITAQPYIPQYAMSSYSKKMIFDGSDDYIELATEKTIAAADAFSLSFWYYNIDTSSSQIILGKDGSTDDYLSLGAGDESLIFKAGGSSKTLDFNSDLTAGKLNHIVLTSPGGTGTMKCYLNGILQDDTETSLNANFDYRHIFRNTTDYGKGFIDELAHFSKELSATEVQEIFNAGMALDCRDHSAFLGDEEVVDGDFALANNVNWTKNAEDAWTFSGGKASVDSSGTAGLLQTLSGVTVGKVYDVSFEISDYSYGSFQFASGVFFPIGTSTSIPNATSNGTYSYRTIAQASSPGAYVYGVNESKFSVDNISVKEVQLNGYWRNNGTDTWYDLSPYGNNGTVNGSPTTIQLQEVPYFKKDTFGLPMNKVRERALNLDGDSYIEITDDNSLDFGTGAFSIDGWARFAFENSGSTSGNVIFVSGGNPVGATSGSFAILTNIGNDTRSIRFLVNGEEIDVNITSRVADGDWFHFAATRDTSGNLELYIDSESVGILSATGNSGATVSTTAVRSIGRDSSTSTRNYKNLIDDIRLYNRELLADEVAKNYKAAKSKHKNNIVSNWSDDFSDSFI